MKGIHKFDSQVQGLQFFMEILISAANCGWFKTDEVKKLFREAVASLPEGSSYAAQSWELLCSPILAFFKAISEGNECCFEEKIKKGPCFLGGSLSWYSARTEGRFIRVVFQEQTLMYFDTGDLRSPEIEKKKSRFLGLPEVGDEIFPDCDREKFHRFAFGGEDVRGVLCTPEHLTEPVEIETGSALQEAESGDKVPVM